ncbi:hypothetical protein BKA62DRAFT_68851 [Auriculariales sp. MPI-PUGE-AT-0066]|nr:hypothetical protein BKA62DRAFT_68851 [Auriculariales sp. MPI-PUGE-AT-0066]
MLDTGVTSRLLLRVPNDTRATPSEQIAVLVDAQLRILATQQHTRYFAVAFLSVVLFDHFITLDQEVQFVYKWKGRWWWRNWPSTIFFINRYFIYILLALANMMFFVSNPSISQCAFWDRSRCVFYGLYGLLVVCTLANVITRILGYRMTATPGPKNSQGCLLKPRPNIWVNLIGSMVFDTALFTLTLFRSWRLHRESGQSWQERSPIISHLLQTGTWYYMAVFLVTLLVFISYVLHSVLPTLVHPSIILVTITSVLSSRLLMFTRSALGMGVPQVLQLDTQRSDDWDFERRQSGLLPVFDPKAIFLVTYTTMTTTPCTSLNSRIELSGAVELSHPRATLQSQPCIAKAPNPNYDTNSHFYE